MSALSITPLAPEVQGEFWKRVDKTEGGCWEWNAGRYQTGYGRFWVRGRNFYTHRVAYELAFGSIPEGAHICHRCDNPPCVNPAHLYAGSPSDNARDREQRKRRLIYRGESHPNHILTEADVISIHRDHQSGRGTVRQLAAQYGVSRATVGALLTGRSWKHVTAGQGGAL